MEEDLSREGRLGRRRLLAEAEHVHDRDQPGRRPALAKRVLVDEGFDNLGGDEGCAGELLRGELLLELRAALLVAARGQARRAREQTPEW